MTENLLVEILAEELPPKALKTLGERFAAALAAFLAREGFAPEHAAATAYATPRRLAAHIVGVRSEAPDKSVAQKLMPVSVGLDAAGAPTPALLKKLAALGADASVVPRLRRENDGKIDLLFYDTVVQGAPLAEGLQKALEAALAALPVPKVMNYQLADGWTSVHFARPAHGLVALHGSRIVPVSVLGLKASGATRGHRFEASADPVAIDHADHYAALLREKGAVIASFAERRAEIVRQLADAAARAGNGLRPVEDEALLDEVTALVERPNVLVGRFAPEFLSVPQECLILTMKANQKYFPLLDAKGNLAERFLMVSNLTPADPSAIIGGNERVVRPRLADARFFFEQDRKKSLESRIPRLAQVVYHNRLGSQGARSERVASLARMLAEALGESAACAREAEQAAMLSKADLLTDMVSEFPELQGVMGRYYALNDGLPVAVADAIEDHYRPRFAGDALPRGRIGLIVALADKLETLIGFFGVGIFPSGDKDPFALRRHALGVIRLLIEGNLNLPLMPMLSAAAERFAALEFFASAGLPAVIETLSGFLYERLSGLLREEGYSAQEVEAVLSQKPQRLGEIPRRLAAVRAFSKLPEADALAAANKRVGNILKKTGAVVEPTVRVELLSETAEIALHAALADIVPRADAAFMTGDYEESLRALAALRAPIDEFFESVLVNAEAPEIRANRLGLLARLRAAMNRIADLSCLAG
ncbi:MAG: glycine--tRNA ligase subunit beta [Zoogloeaceae bacterium]|jgi:glycyl-tRNA synthetase beta chain|nr:glycine--tRNA ligase subunit beta [Zoogloeaceae bacterium]